MASTKILATSRAASASTVRLTPMTPPKADTGSHSRALRQASASEGCSAQPHGLVCLMMPTVLVTELTERPSLDVATLAQRLGSSRGVFERVRSLSGVGALSAEQFEVVEEVLLRSDVGVATTTMILDNLRVNGAPDGVANAVRASLLDSLTADRSVTTTAQNGRVPVWLFVGVNGVGKTTTIGKLAKRQIDEGRSVVLAAGDTFRAAAADQLEQWATRTGADIVRSAEGADPGSVVHDALGRAAARGADIVLADTAGRRSNSTNLLDELSKARSAGATGRAR